MTTAANSNKTRGQEGQNAAAAEVQRVERRQQLLREECAKRGVRFLPRQVMRPIYELAGLI